ncbi:protocatechuate 3,4-dioxygenase [Pseudomaricurvus alkylphenolicus]|jgi:protocatechuate 4,5-dioxygenase beta chain|uniref:class III extradiol dioxygenase family protein n=1 Tax=Pseudomaricurvus alkylphenolicus TaxID=1306991 RepID=UPI001420C262|nr:class III extradiol dioxygenase family protein [Pseudomaricurvus alkylphenolicus]NIB38500.1 protocatechuate 3,4-dioxygenase [Pseudomaricurvus alkylphenolicus]
MGKIVAGVGTSHVPSYGVAYDTNQQDNPKWAPVFEGYAPAKAWLKEIGVTHAIVIYNDHGTDFFYDKYPTFAMGAADEYPIGDEGWGPRNLPSVKGDSDFSWHLANSLVKESEFDLTICQQLEVDHGLLSPHPFLFDHDPDWDVKTVPLNVNVLQHPLPTARRLWKLGQGLRKAVESYPQDARVAVIGTGGLSHQLHGNRFGHMNEAWDHEFLDLIEDNPEALIDLPHDTWMERGGAESVEMTMWLAMRGAMTPKVKKIHRFYYLPMLTGMALTVLEDDTTEAA